MPMTSTPQQRREFSDALRAAIGRGGPAGRDEWAEKRQEWLTATGELRVELEGLDLGKKTLRGYDFSHCRIHDTAFAEANLRHVDFSQSIFRGCDFDGADLRGASFFGADLRDEPSVPAPNRLTGTHFDRTTDMEVNKGMLAGNMDQGLIDMAHMAWRRTDWWRRRSRSRLYKLLKYATDYGFSVVRLLALAGGVMTAFAGLFYLSDRQAGALAAALNSVRYFIALSDPYEAHRPILSALGMVEAGLGFVALAMLVAIFTSKFTDL